MMPINNNSFVPPAQRKDEWTCKPGTPKKQNNSCTKIKLPDLKNESCIPLPTAGQVASVIFSSIFGKN